MRVLVFDFFVLDVPVELEHVGHDAVLVAGRVQFRGHDRVVQHFLDFAINRAKLAFIK